VKLANLSLRTLFICLLAVYLFGCISRHSVYNLTADRSRQIIETTELSSAKLCTRGWARFIYDNDLPQALIDLKKAISLSAKEKPETINNQQNIVLAYLGIGLIQLLQADFAQAAIAFLQTIKTDPRLPESLIAAFQLREVLHQVPEGHKLIGTELDSILKDYPTLGLEMTRMLNLIRKEGAIRAGNIEQASIIEKKMGVIPFWSTAYPYGQHPMADFEIPFGPEEKPIEDSGKRKIVPAIPEDGTLILRREPAGLLYAQSYFKTEKSQTTELVIRIETDTAWTVFVDNQLLKQHNVFHHKLPHVVYLPFRASSGWHRLLLKTPVDSKTSISIEVTDINGQTAPIKWWTSTDLPNIQRGSAATKMTRSVNEHLIRRLADNPNDTVSSILLALYEWENGAMLRSRKYLNLAQQQAPKFAFIDYLLGLFQIYDPDTPYRLSYSRSQKHLRQAIEKCPEMLLAHFRLALLLKEDGKHQEALKKLSELEQKKPENYIWSFFKGKIFEKLGWQLETDRAFKRSLKLLADDPEVLRHLFGRALRQNDFSTSTKLAQLLEQYGLWDLELVDFWQKKENDQHAINILNKIIQRYPARIEHRLWLAKIYIRQKNLKGAKKEVDQALLYDPYHPEALNIRANILDLKQKPSKALIFRKNNLSSSHRNLADRQSFIASNLRPKKLVLVGEKDIDTDQEIKKYLSSNFINSGQVTFVLDQQAVEVAQDGSFSSSTHMIVHVTSSEGLENWGEFNGIPHDAIVNQLRTIKANGQTFDAESISNNRDSVSFPSLEIGDFVEFAYMENSPSYQPSPDKMGFISNRWHFHAPDTPIYHSLFTVAVPKNIKLEVDSHGEDYHPTINHNKDYRIYSWEHYQSAQIKTEPNSPPLDEISPFVQVGLNINWYTFRNILREKLTAATLPSWDLLQFAKKMIADQPDENKLLSKLLSTVNKKINQKTEYFDFYEPASHILAQREGNRVTLLVALLKIMGYEPQVLLVRTISDSQVDYRFPNFSTYTYPLVGIKAKTWDQKIWLDPTQRYSSFGIIYPFLQGMQAIDISSSSDSALFFKVPSTPAQNQIAGLKKNISLELTLDSDGTVRGAGLETISTSQAVQYRQLLSPLNSDQRRQVMEIGLGHYFRNALLKKYEIVSLEDANQPLVIKYELEIPEFAKKIDNTWVIQDGFYPYQLSKSLISSPTRKYPLLLDDETHTKTNVTIKLPEGATINNGTDIVLDAPLSTFSHSTKVQDNNFVLQKSLVVKPGRIYPQDYQEFKSFCHQVDSIDNQEIQIEIK
jgi:tetratricopeptide (TPR) repeat protein